MIGGNFFCVINRIPFRILITARGRASRPTFVFLRRVLLSCKYFRDFYERRER